jgi:protein phosphatase
LSLVRSESSRHTPLSVRIGHASERGRRERNEDFVGAVTPAGTDLVEKGVVLAVADGVSGVAGGREAAEHAVRAVLADYYATPSTWTIRHALDRVLTALNSWLVAHSSANRELAGMATTLTILVLRGTRWYAAHVGDTRIYRSSGSECVQLTADHVCDRPDLRHVLKRAVGLDHHLVVDYSDGELQPGDTFLLCSDGVWEPLGDARIAQTLAAGGDPQSAAADLVDGALRKGGQDNATALVVRVDAVPAQQWSDALGAVFDLKLPPRLRPGQRIDELEVLGLVHESRATLLYRVRSQSGQDLALKTLQPALADDSRSCEALLIEEWLSKRLLAKCFPQVVPLSSAQRSHLYYVMTFHRGLTLQQQLDRGRHFSVAEAVQIGIEVAKGLGVLHRLQVLHRDIKPANLLRGDDGVLRILDMGVALAAGVPYPELEGNPGTPSFMAPELFEGKPASAQSDLYAAGVTLYHLLTRKYPYGEIEPFQHPRFGEPVRPTRYRPDVPRWLENLLARAVARDLEQRFETAEELLLALERGDTQAVSPLRRTPLLQRDPARVWQSIALILLVINLLLLYCLLIR